VKVFDVRTTNSLDLKGLGFSCIGLSVGFEMRVRGEGLELRIV